MNDRPKLEDILTADEAAEKLRLTRRAVITLGKRYGLCLEHGRTVLFTEAMLVELVEAMRFKPTSPIQERYALAYSGAKTAERLQQILQKKQQEREERKQARRLEDARAREARLEEKRKATIAKREQKAAARAEKKRAAQAAAEAQTPEPLDRTSRPPAYWTPERKAALRQERVSRMKQWGPK